MYTKVHLRSLAAMPFAPLTKTKLIDYPWSRVHLKLPPTFFIQAVDFTVTCFFFCFSSLLPSSNPFCFLFWLFSLLTDDMFLDMNERVGMLTDRPQDTLLLSGVLHS